MRELHRLALAQRDQFQTAHEAILALDGLDEGLAALPARHRRPPARRSRASSSARLDDLIALTQTYFNANSDRLNAVATRLTIGGTLFVIWTVVTGFFGQNFGWLVDNIDTKHDFLLFGVGGARGPDCGLAHTVLGQARRLVLRAA